MNANNYIDEMFCMNGGQRLQALHSISPLVRLLWLESLMSPLQF